MDIFKPFKWLFKDRTLKDDVMIRHAKLAKETGDFVFRVAQMWIVLSIVRFASINNPIILPLFWFLAAVLIVYSLVTPWAFVLEWDVASRKADGKPRARSGVLLAVLLVYAAVPAYGIEDAVDMIHDATTKAATNLPRSTDPTH